MSKKLLLAPLTALVLGAAAVPSVALADTWFECQAVAVIENSNRVSVTCSNTFDAGADDIVYFAIPNTDAAKTARFVAMASTAVASGQVFTVLTPTASTTNVSGCLTTNCRTPSSYGLKNEN